MSFLLKNYPLVKVIYLLIRCYKIEIYKNGVNKQNTRTHTNTSSTRAR